MRCEIVKAALAEYGVIEQSGPEDNSPRILDYFKEIGHSWVKTDETAWCSAFVNYVAKVAGYEYSGKLNARSWLDIGLPTDDPEIGDVVIFWRVDPDSWKGHVGIFIKKDGDDVLVLGGNQKNQVRISKYPGYRVLGYRILNRK
jgi:uncharacterized protein (TIGR02594 family)